jgi:hypothetical protein
MSRWALLYLLECKTRHFPLKFGIKYDRSSETCTRSAEPDCSTLYHVEPNQGLYHQIKYKQMRDESLAKRAQPSFLGLGTSHIFFLKKRDTLGSQLRFCFLAKDYLTWCSSLD